MKLQFKPGFTLIELIITITLIGILSGVAAQIIFYPFKLFTDTIVRTDIVSLSNSSFSRLRYDLHRSAPHSVRVKTDSRFKSIEFFLVNNIAIYKRGWGNNTNEFLVNTEPDDNFKIITSNFLEPYDLSKLILIISHYGLTNINTNIPIPGKNIYAVPDGIIHTRTTPGNIESIVDTGNYEYEIKLSSPMIFTQHSENQAVYLSSGPVSYICDLKNMNLYRVSGYSISSTQIIDIDDIHFIGNSASKDLLVNNVTNCLFSLDENLGILNISLSLSKNNLTIPFTDQIYIGRPI